ncbi:MAG TPA: hypothetical protein VL134_08235 [Leptolyngbya sp.]|nr:hypothetical protein [Leptolyngbya sp.]
MHSVSKKFSLYVDRAEQLQARGVGRRNALLLFSTQTTVLLSGEWLEAFWCDECQQTKWYHVQKLGQNRYKLSQAPGELWQQATGVIHPDGNTSVGEFTRQQARMPRYDKINQFHFTN